MENLKHLIKITMTIQDIYITNFPLVILTDTHTNLVNLKKLQGLYSNAQFICLGDITSLWSKAEKYNEHSIKYFRESNIPCLKGNHEEHIFQCQRGGKQYLFRAIPSFGEYDISEESLKFIQNLPIGFKIHLPNGKHYLAFHNTPDDLWGFNDNISKEKFLNTYPINKNTIGVICGHHHKSFIKEFDDIEAKFIGVGALKDKRYAILTDNGLLHHSL